jgi:hypothetical protein
MSRDFSEILTSLPFTPATTQGRGFFGPLNRTTGHFLYLLGRTSDTISRRPTDNQITEELNALSEHLSEFVVPDYMSQRAKDYVATFLEGVQNIRDNFLSWDEETRINNLRSFCNRISQIHVFLDREVLGIPNSDAGQSL